MSTVDSSNQSRDDAYPQGVPAITTPMGDGPRLPSGTTLNDRYVVEDFVGRGPFGEAYRARDRSDNRLVSIKAIHPILLSDAAVRKRLDAAVLLAVQLDHKNIGQTYGIHDADVRGDKLTYIASEYIDGQSLKAMLDKNQIGGRAFSLKAAYNVVAHLCNGLVYAHAVTLHGGISPESVMVNSAGRVKLADFGLASTLTPFEHYPKEAFPDSFVTLAPEVVSDPSLADSRADLYSVGVVLFELLTGRAPNDLTERPSHIVPAIPQLIDVVVETCLHTAPHERYTDAQALKDALQAALTGTVGGHDPATGTGLRPYSASGASKPAQTPPSGSSASPLPTLQTAGTPPPPPPFKPARTGGGSTGRSSTGSKPAQLPDENTEHWLITKDKMDFGPFSLREIRVQIETGKILPEHLVTDTDTGDRRRVRENPHLKQMLLHAEVKLAEKARVEGEAVERGRHRNRVLSMLGIILLLVVGGVGLTVWYVTHMKPKVIVQKETTNDLDFLKGMEISLKVDPPVPHKPGATAHKTVKRSGPGGTASANGNDFSDVTHFGDVSEEGGDETLPQEQVAQVMKENFKVLVGCVQDEHRRNASLHNVEMDFIIKGSGSVSGVKVNGQTGTQLATCMFERMKTVPFPKFNGTKTHASFSLAIK